MSGEPGPDGPSPWRVRTRQVVVGAVLIGLGMSIGASVRQSLPASSKPSPTPSPPAASSPPATGGRAVGLPQGGSGALILLSGSAQGLPGGPDGELVWRVDLASGRVQMGPAVATQSPAEIASGGVMYPNYSGNSPPPAAIATTPARVVVYEESGQSAFLATAPIGGADFGSIPLRPQAAIADYSVAPGGRIAFVNTNWTGAQGPPMQQAGILGRRLAYQGHTPGLLLSDAYVIGRGLYATGVQGRNPGPGSRPVVLRVAHGRLRVVLAGWQVLGEDPAGRGLLVERLTRFGSGVRISPRPMLWRPGSSPRPALNRDLAVESVLASFRGGVDGLLVSGRFRGSPGLFQTLPRGTVVPVPLPAGLDPSNVGSAAFAGSEAVYLVGGLGQAGLGQAYVCQISIGGCRTLRISGPLSELPILAVAWAR